MELTLYNSLTRKKDVFKPADPKRVTMYNCGPTVYSYAHIGNARAAVVADVLFRVLRHIYGEDHVVYARNITDVDDRIIKAAAELDVPIEKITEKYARIYNEDLAALGCLEPTYQPKATDNIKEMQDIIVELMDKDIAYASQGHILFDVTQMKKYGKLSGRKLDDNLAGARVEVASYKKNPGDFILWKPAADDEPGWEFGNHGRGRPGWHIECSAMIRNVLGKTIDIHCGGIDLKFPHHENEIAQSECANEKPLARFWIHNEFLNMGKDKMSKSKGNIVLVRDLLKNWDGEVIRLALLKAHYRSELVWSDDLLKESKAQLDGWYRLKANIHEYKIEPTELYFPQNPLPLFDDLGLPGTLKELSAMVEFLMVRITYNKKNVGLSEVKDKQFNEEIAIEGGRFLRLSALLGLLQKDPEEWFRGKGKDGGLSDGEIEALILERSEVRAAKNWARADEIRDVFAKENIILEDGKDGTAWRRG